MYEHLIRPCLEYANVLLVGYTRKQAALLKSIQKKAQLIIERYPDTSVHLPYLQAQTEQATIKLIQEMVQNDHPLHYLLPPTRGEKTGRLLRRQSNMTSIKAKTKHYASFTIPFDIRFFNEK